MKVLAPPVGKTRYRTTVLLQVWSCIITLFLADYVYQVEDKENFYVSQELFIFFATVLCRNGRSVT